jgi:hypothetical protein
MPIRTSHLLGSACHAVNAYAVSDPDPYESWVIRELTSVLGPRDLYFRLLVNSAGTRGRCSQDTKRGKQRNHMKIVK